MSKTKFIEAELPFLVVSALLGMILGYRVGAMRGVVFAVVIIILLQPFILVPMICGCGSDRPEDVSGSDRDVRTGKLGIARLVLLEMPSILSSLLVGGIFRVLGGWANAIAMGGGLFLLYQVFTLFTLIQHRSRSKA